MMTDDFEAIQASLADLATVRSVLDFAGHAISDDDSDRASELLQFARDAIAGLLLTLRGGVCVYPP